jgi:hypothetical protein
MADCPFYREITETIESRELTPHSRPPTQLKRALCGHKDAPRRLNRKVIGPGVLTCGGMIDRCQLPGGFNLTRIPQVARDFRLRLMPQIVYIPTR